MIRPVFKISMLYFRPFSGFLIFPFSLAAASGITYTSMLGTALMRRSIMVDFKWRKLRFLTVLPMTILEMPFLLA